MSFVLGGLTVGMTYLLQPEIITLGWRVLADGLVVPLHDPIVGGITRRNQQPRAWSNSMTPLLFTTAGLWLVVRAVYQITPGCWRRRGSFRSCTAISLGARMFLPAVAVYCVWKRPGFCESLALCRGGPLPHRLQRRDPANILNPGDTLAPRIGSATPANYLVDGPLAENGPSLCRRNNSVW